MCGLLGGISTGFVANEYDVLYNLFFINCFRGTDSTGMFDYIKFPDRAKGYKNAKHIAYWKTEQHPITFLDTTFNGARKKRWDSTVPIVIAGHTRYATKGTVTKDNCHPFAFDNIIGMHNGTIGGDFKHSKEFNTDSEALYYCITKYGLEETLDIIKDASPAYALVWLDSKKETINWFRNSQRPLAMTKGHGVRFWSSDIDHLKLAIKASKAFATEYLELKEGILYSWELGKPMSEVEEKEIKVPVPSKTYASPMVYSEYGEWAQQGWAYNRDTSSKNISGVVIKLKITGIHPWIIDFMEVPAQDWNQFARSCNNKNNIYPANISVIQAEDRGRLQGDTYASVKDTITNKYFTPYAAAVVCIARMREWGALDKTEISEGKKEAEEAKKETNLPFEPDEIPEVLKRHHSHCQKPEVINGVKFDRHFGVGLKKVCSTLRYEEKIKGGCCWCGDPVSLESKLFWASDDDFICETCQDIAGHKDHEIHRFINNLDELVKHPTVH